MRADCHFTRSFVAVGLLGAVSALGGDWTNLGGNAARNGLMNTLGPTAEDSLWNNNDSFSIIAWAPFTLGERVFTIRESGFPQSGGAANDALVAYDLNTGDELWRKTLPFSGNTSQEWIAWIAGVGNGRVYASRSTNGTFAPIYAYDATNGALLWTSDDLTQAFAYDGVIFAPNGDLIVGDFTKLFRINAVTGDNVWTRARACSVSGNCGAAASGDAIYIDQPVPGGAVISKVDMNSGAVLYSTPVMPGFTEQNQPFVSPDGTRVYHARTQNNPAVDFLYAFEDTGVDFAELWHVPVLWTTSHEHGIGPDGSIYTFLPNNEFVRLDPDTGEVMDTAGTLSPLTAASPKTAVASDGTVYVSNGWASTPATQGRMWAFPPDLSTKLMTLHLDRQNQGGPALGASGTLVMTDRVGVHAYRSDVACVGDLDNDNDVDIEDLATLLSNYGIDTGATPEQGDLDLDGDVDITDLASILSAYGSQC